MKLQEPRGFPRTSSTARIMEHVEDSAGGRKAGPELDLAEHLASLYNLPRANPYVRTLAKVIKPAVPLETAWSAAREERTMYLPVKGANGQAVHRIKKDGTEGAAETMKVVFETLTVTVTVGPSSFELRATNKGPNILDGRTGQRRPIDYIRADLVRILGEEKGNAAAAELASVLPVPREPRAKVRLLRELPPPNPPGENGLRVEGTLAAVTMAELTDEVWSSIAHRETAVERFEKHLAKEAKAARSPQRKRRRSSL